MSCIEQNINPSMVIDLYELTMANAYIQNGMESTVAYFDMFFRNIPDSGGFAIMAGLEQLIEYFKNIKFSQDDLKFLKDKNIFSDRFLEYLRDFKFSCDLWSVPEGTPIFPNEPIITVRGPIIQAQMIETMLLLIINHQSLIATKANRVVRAARGRPVAEFGSRRAQGISSAVYGARAAFIGGCSSTACVMSDKMFSIPSSGTMSHSWVQMFESEYEAFKSYAKQYPNKCLLLVDTYSTIHSGIPNAIRVFNEEIVPLGFRPYGIRIDSGDITYLSKRARELLDDAGFSDCKIIVSNSLDEYKISSILEQGAKIDAFGVGERLINSASDPIFGGVYKLCAIEKKQNIVPRIKISDNISKISNPGVKEIWRIFDKNTKKAMADIITLFDEKIDTSNPYTIFDPQNTWKKKVLNNFNAVKIRKKIFSDGNLVYKSPHIEDIQSYCASQVECLWDEVKRFEMPHKYYVDLSKKLWNQKQKLLTNGII